MSKRRHHAALNGHVCAREDNGADFFLGLSHQRPRLHISRQIICRMNSFAARSSNVERSCTTPRYVTAWPVVL